MSIVVPLKAGEILVPKPGSWNSYTRVELKAEIEFKSMTFWSIVMTNKNGSQHLDTLREDVLREGWVRKPSFFQLGKTYGFKSRQDTWKILDLYQLENGVFGDDKKAVALMTYKTNGKTDIQALSLDDFDRMVEV